jgi:hypothetical protein
MPRLTVATLYQRDVYRDVARIPERHRTDKSGRRIEEAKLCEVTVGSRTALLFLRGEDATDSPIIRLDGKTRDRLNLPVGQTADFELKVLDFCGEVRWAWDATEPAYRITARLALASVALGLLGFALAVISMVQVK